MRFEEGLPEPDDGLWLVVRNQVALFAALHAMMEVMGAGPEARRRLELRIERTIEWLERSAAPPEKD